MADKDLTVWETGDEITRTNLDRITCRYLLTEDEVIPGGVEEAYRRVQFETGHVAREAKTQLDVLLHLTLNLMRADSGLDFTSETNPDNWSMDELEKVIVHTRKKRRRVAGSGQGQASADNFVWTDVPDKEVGWGNSYVANTNPTNSDGQRNTNDPRPGWWYRMAYSDNNRETLLRTLKFWEPDKVGRMVDGMIVSNQRRLDQLMADPRRERAMDYLNRTRELLGDNNQPNTAMKDALSEEVVEAIQRDLANKNGTQAVIAERHGVSAQTVNKINTGKYRTAVAK